MPIALTSISPDFGPPTGGTPVTIKGTGFVSGLSVDFDGAPATNISVVNSTTITCDTPAGVAGNADVRVQQTVWQSGDQSLSCYGLAATPNFDLLLAAGNGGYLWTSTDIGVTWTQRESSRNWRGAAASSDGAYLYAVVSGQYAYRSTDEGVSWSAITSVAKSWNCVCCSSSGQHVDGTASRSKLLVSNDYGVTWSEKETARLGWTSIACSSDGSVVVATCNNSYVWVSTDYGANWTQTGSVRNWFCAAVSPDGAILAAGVSTGYIYTSTDNGANWSQSGSASASWYDLKWSADGSTLVGAVYGGSGIIHYSTDAGASFSTLPATSLSTLQRIAVNSDATIYAAGQSSTAAIKTYPHTQILWGGFQYLVATAARLTRLATEAFSTSDPTASLSRLAVEALSTSDVAAYLSRLTIEVLSRNVETRRRPQFFTYLIPD